MRSPIDTGLIHFVGIGGIGMSGIAEILLNLGYQVQGSDAAENANVKRLRELGATIHVGHDAAHLGAARVVVVSSAIKRDNPELMAARHKRIPVVRRADMLAQLMRFRSCIAVAGTHGKTTTTSIVAALLDAGDLDPTVINGGIINALGTNARLGKGDWMVVEADESDGTFVRLPAEVGIITNIDPEHLDHYGSFDAAKAAFATFVENLPFYGFAVMCSDHPEVQALVGRIEDRTVVTYGENPQADMRLVDVEPGPDGTRFAVIHRARLTGEETRLDDLMLPMPGRHNVLNAVAALTVAYRLGVPLDKIRAGLKNFAGVKRRFTLTGRWNEVPIYDDYGHHPVEIAAALRAAREATKGRVIAVMQPHRYTRLHDLFDDFCGCFNDADKVLIADVYTAGESPIEGASSDALVAGIRNRGHRDVRRLERPDALARLIADMAAPGDLVICLGAGSITQWAYALPAQLQSINPPAGEVGA